MSKRKLHRDGQELRKGKGKSKRPRQHEICHLNPAFSVNTFTHQLSKSWSECSSFEDAATSAQLFDSPFQCCRLPNFITSSPAHPGSSSRCEVANGDGGGVKGADEFLHTLVSELLRLKFYEKNNDLYQFHQSDDLKKFKTPCIAALRDLFRDECLPWLRKVTGLELTDTIDMTCSKYEYTDVLLCHDDELEGRRIAFILYLVPEWSEEDGGALDLFDTDAEGYPGKVVRSLVPVWNNFVFFDVNAVSFHQVSEVVAAGKTRLSINGWFHGPPPHRPPTQRPHPLPLAPPISLGLEVLSDWINPTYLDVGVLSQIQQQFEEESQIELPNFLLEEKYDLICEEMAASHAETKWTEQGPPNYKRTSVAASSSLPPLSHSLMDMFLSMPFCLLLAHMTDLDLAQDVIKDTNPCLAQDTTKESSDLQDKTKKSPCLTQDTARKSSDLQDKTKKSRPDLGSEEKLRSLALCGGEMRCWRHGDYTLAQDARQERACLEANLCFNCKGWSEELGGVVNYIISDSSEDPEVLTVCPTPNSLSLVYREKDLLHFTKYLNHRTRDLTSGPLYTANLTYVEHSDTAQGTSEGGDEEKVWGSKGGEGVLQD